ncbi:alpha-amylase family glycosyl hydrolase [Aeoliella mucimassa]|uniref:Neopullulanase n=1 Tax=Aeoliella mucimassa TaxID=2527972 RepID=A0A518AHL3_9BACT|nr:alpha-amylase family glycosyl hydrolase [Aeoliella mucimassa]QDU54185.1 Neopullulanase [Aeoliella mucimassa]
MTCSDIWYHLYPLGFLAAEERNPAPGAAEGPTEHRLARLNDWLDYWTDLGVTGLLLGPVFESETHGYDIVDPFRIDRRLGDEGDLVRLIDACHERGIKVALDMVFNHVGRAHPHFVDVLTHGRESSRSGWFRIDFDQPGYDGFSYATFEGHGGLVELNHANPEVLDWAVDVARHWLDRGVDAFRLDAAYAIPADFLRAFGERVRQAKADVLLVGEMIHGDYRSMIDASQLNSLTQYELWKALWSSLNDRNFFELAHALTRHAEFCQSFQPWTFVGNHDTTRIASKLTDRRHLPHALAVLMTMPGMPALYAGDEQGAEGVKYDREGGDAEIRRPLPHAPGDAELESSPIWQLHRELIAIRRARPWLATAEVNVTNLSNLAVTIELRGDGQMLVVVLNTDDQPTACQVPPGLRPLAGDLVHQPEATELPGHGWGVWGTE